ncbi:hypothetical protein Ahy_B01g054998 isoform D [Arachis hypogaea]|uniref:Uncharacterized protein n=1 Tax=Arachis hypogaea TaxID=3818 RepID=A0A445AUS5_ARAHY|nr:hypothetical protein Ahy_B01g054998 isoform D [Arachis hypogaea]
MPSRLRWRSKGSAEKVSADSSVVMKSTSLPMAWCVKVKRIWICSALVLPLGEIIRLICDNFLLLRQFIL